MHDTRKSEPPEYLNQNFFLTLIIKISRRIQHPPLSLIQICDGDKAAITENDRKTRNSNSILPTQRWRKTTR
ncbi:hypothetical protein L2E82_35896 [Cichorium intybus]|uniref:Uncharacterized protein n=1 Tax=Cichorium intybus TaxID=13427 RepID=A0ACB9BQ15_CICIN|nr:hypothetical protein L2E82_35896 [Cichorium intybus]